MGGRTIPEKYFARLALGWAPVERPQQKKELPASLFLLSSEILFSKHARYAVHDNVYVDKAAISRSVYNLQISWLRGDTGLHTFCDNLPNLSPWIGVDNRIERCLQSETLEAKAAGGTGYS